MTKLRQLALLVLVVTLGSSANVYAARTVAGNTIVSKRDPAVSIRISPAARYVGTDAWTLYGIADCQIFVYAQAGSDKIVGRLYWVQFEAYVPSMPKLTHDYESPQHAKIGGVDFFVDSWVESSTPSAPNVKKMEAALASLGYATPPGIDSGSDYQHVVALLKRRGYTLPEHMASLRLVHLLDPQTRKELMIIYSVPAASDFGDDAVVRKTLLDEARRNIHLAF